MSIKTAYRMHLLIMKAKEEKNKFEGSEEIYKIADNYDKQITENIKAKISNCT